MVVFEDEDEGEEEAHGQERKGAVASRRQPHCKEQDVAVVVAMAVCGIYGTMTTKAAYTNTGSSQQCTHGVSAATAVLYGCSDNSGERTPYYWNHITGTTSYDKPGNYDLINEAYNGLGTGMLRGERLAAVLVPPEVRREPVGLGQWGRDVAVLVGVGDTVEECVVVGGVDLLPYCSS